MKVTLSRKAALEAFSAVAGIVPTRSPKPILANVKMICSHTDVTFLATDLEVGIRRFVEDAQVTEPGAVILPMRVGQILRLSNDDTIVIQTEGDKLHVIGDRSSWELPSEDPDLFPAVPDFDAADYFEVQDSSLKAAIRRTMFATDDSASSRFALGGVLWEFGIGRMTLVGTNGRCMAEHVIAAEVVGDPGDFANDKSKRAPVVPMKALKLIDKLIGDDGDCVHIAINPLSHILVRTTRETIYSRTIDGRFPRYQDVYNSDVNWTLEIPASDLLSGVNQASILTSEESRGVDFHFKLGELSLSSQSADRGAARISVPMGGDGVPFVIVMDPEYLTPMLRTIPEDSTISIKMVDNKHGIQFDFDDSYKYVVMPLTRDR